MGRTSREEKNRLSSVTWSVGGVQADEEAQKKNKFLLLTQLLEDVAAVRAKFVRTI